LELGFQVWAQNVTWDDLMAQASAIDALGFDTLWSNDHFYPLVSMDDAINRTLTVPIFEGWMVLGGFAAATERVRLGCLVSGAGYRNVGVLAKMATTLDHASHGRAVLGIGAGWFEREHTSFGLEFPSAGARLDRLEESAAALRRLLDGETVTAEGAWVRLREARLDPAPRQARLPIMIGGSGPRRTLPIVARFADVWNGEGTPAELAERNRRLDELCAEAGRAPTAVVRTVGLPPPLIRDTAAEAAAALVAIFTRHGMPAALAREQAQASAMVGPADRVAAELAAYHRAGADGVIFDWPSPFDPETLAALAGPVRQLVDTDTGTGATSTSG
jgi:alkanesulfonate monooxygenase SsuD/methylene tetrahydromethanopterin reductase-like flavin-dependent oxidoreductase (luciferase family)